MACKQWNELPGLKTKKHRTSQKSAGFAMNTWTLIRFRNMKHQTETSTSIFRKDGCLHGTDPACVKVLPQQLFYYTPMKTVEHSSRQVHRLQGMHRCLSV